MRKDSRRQGVGIALLESISVLLEGGRHFTSTETDNVAAVNLFKSVGYVSVGQLSHVNFDGSLEEFYVKGNLDHVSPD